MGRHVVTGRALVGREEYIGRLARSHDYDVGRVRVRVRGIDSDDCQSVGRDFEEQLVVQCSVDYSEEIGFPAYYVQLMYVILLINYQGELGLLYKALGTGRVDRIWAGLLGLHKPWPEAIERAHATKEFPLVELSCVLVGWGIGLRIRAHRPNRLEVETHHA
ncbi:phosphate acyltransferase [Striga asiatica]|uniref:Phosphate acyltransferase n=1 Tax=Striga asiatica TaxID=4170 RepID=A0A5A7RF87_STRAF|nr:phosphate acyltransferase [Striga asiatica]